MLQVRVLPPQLCKQERRSVYTGRRSCFAFSGRETANSSRTEARGTEVSASPAELLKHRLIRTFLDGDCKARSLTTSECVGYYSSEKFSRGDAGARRRATANALVELHFRCNPHATYPHSRADNIDRQLSLLFSAPPRPRVKTVAVAVAVALPKKADRKFSPVSARGAETSASQCLRARTVAVAAAVDVAVPNKKSRSLNFHRSPHVAQRPPRLRASVRELLKTLRSTPRQTAT